MAGQELWRKTKLWELLAGHEGPEAERTLATAAAILRQVEAVLGEGDTTPSSYTLHDPAHSRRVAELIAKIAGPQLEHFSAFELALLILASYLHDIGMTPPVGKVNAHFSYLLSGDPGELSREEQGALQVFLDDHWDGETPPLHEGTPSPQVIARAGQITAAYTRDRHVEWGAQWMQDELVRPPDDLYGGWFEDLALLCASHHFGIETLRHSDFNPRLVGSNESILHLRLCACLLRVADVLEFDPERTPKVLFAHRNVEDGSVIYWHKDHAIGFSLKDRQVTVHAQPSDAITHHAIACAVGEVERELALCDQLGQEVPFDRMQGHPPEIPYQWPLATHVNRQINPRGDNYVYVDGTFRPDPSRVLDLIGGIELYGDPLVSVRELLQNAFDAVREQIALERLQQPDPAAPRTLTRLAFTHQVQLRLQRRNKQIELVCVDTGSGMSKEILLSRFLVGGRSPNHEIRDLERRCQRRGFSVGRTARFGIGALSYFLIAKHLKLQTRRSLQAGGQEGTGWSFTSKGLDDFGELSVDGSCSQGTTVTLALKDDILKEAGYDEFALSLRRYLLTTLRCVPCRFQFSADTDTALPLEVAPGWNKGEDEVRRWIWQRQEGFSTYAGEVPIELLAGPDKEERELRDTRLNEMRSNAESKLVLSQEEGELPDGLGTYRLHTGFFALEEGTSLGYIELSGVDEEIRIKPILGSDLFVFPMILSTSWNGMKVESEFSEPDPARRDRSAINAVIEIDWTHKDAGQLAVDRNTVKLSNAAEAAVEALVVRAKERLADVGRKETSPRFALLNLRLADTHPEKETELFWGRGMRDDGGQRPFGPIEFPVRAVDPYIRNDRTSYRTSTGQMVSPIEPLRLSGEQAGVSRHLSWHGQTWQPTRIAFLANSQPYPVALWESPRVQPETRPLGDVAFPGELSEMVGYRDPSATLWNRDHSLVRSVDSASWKWTEQLSFRTDPALYAEEILKSPIQAACWILRAVSFSLKDIWNGLADRDPELLSKIWGTAGLPADGEILYLNSEIHNRELRTVSRTHWKELDRAASKQVLDKKIAELDPEWWLTH
jgi:hypothetical protein